MVATNLKAETMKLMEQRSGIEPEMNVIIENLCRPGGPGLNVFIILQGFPRADIDIPAVRAERHRLAELRNDHKDITEKINQNIQVLHSARLTSTTIEDTGNHFNFMSFLLFALIKLVNELCCLFLVF
ncbi:unnamed protein product [Coffea canephora]|uniref:Nas2 N-terminal domain-containing protein n=1 Tax=Coffea canephora TaxID=49390 RepID=A0A068UPT3_COFCA|nr:unnamed protein product [Coffea canephora]